MSGLLDRKALLSAGATLQQRILVTTEDAPQHPRTPGAERGPSPLACLSRVRSTYSPIRHSPHPATIHGVLEGRFQPAPNRLSYAEYTAVQEKRLIQRPLAESGADADHAREASESGEGP